MSDWKPTILIVEDEISVANANRRMLARRGYEVLVAVTAEEAYRCLEHELPDLLILDVSLPDGSGYDICHWFRERSDHPVLFLSGKTQTEDRMEGILRGGDYYLTKPYVFEELFVVCQRLLQRHIHTKNRHEQLTSIRKGALVLDLSRGKALVDGTDAELTPKEFSILKLLVQNEGRELSAHELYETVWGAPSVNDTRTIRKHIFNLRAKINAENCNDYDIVSTYGRGYAFRCD